MKEKIKRIWSRIRYNYYMQLYSSCEDANHKDKLLKKAHLYKLS
jgi:hypothetical protein